MKGHPVPLTLSGTTYPSIAAAARARGVSRQALAAWLERRARGLRKRGRKKAGGEVGA